MKRKTPYQNLGREAAKAVHREKVIALKCLHWKRRRVSSEWPQLLSPQEIRKNRAN